MVEARASSPCKAMWLCSERVEMAKSLREVFLFWKKMSEGMTEIRLEDTEQILTGFHMF